MRPGPSMPSPFGPQASQSQAAMMEWPSLVPADGLPLPQGDAGASGGEGQGQGQGEEVVIPLARVWEPVKGPGGDGGRDLPPELPPYEQCFQGF
jgi:hypothetical protein